MKYQNFIIYNGDEFDSQEEARSAGHYNVVEVDMDDSRQEAIFRQMKDAFSHEAGHIVVEEETEDAS